MMRKWFRADNTTGLAEADLRVLNRAARHVAEKRDPSHLELVILRTVYRPGMSARDLLTAADGDDDGVVRKLSN
jgi:hypothetical protein